MEEKYHKVIPQNMQNWDIFVAILEKYNLLHMESFVFLQYATIKCPILLVNIRNESMVVSLNVLHLFPFVTFPNSSSIIKAAETWRWLSIKNCVVEKAFLYRSVLPNITVTCGYRTLKVLLIQL